MTDTMSPRSLTSTTRRLTPRPGRGRRLRPHALGELLIIVVLVRVYDLIKELAESRLSVGIHNADGVRSLESTLHIGFELPVNQWFADHHVLSLTASYFYQFGHESITLSVLVACWWLRPQAYRPARNALVAINVVGLTVFALLPVAPPRLLPGAGFSDLVADAGFGTTHGGPVSADQFAAMPSLHLAWATWTAVVLFLWWRRPVLRLLAVVYPIWIAVVVIGTGNHYVLDVVAGVAVAGVCLVLTHPRRERTSSVSQSSRPMSGNEAPSRQTPDQPDAAYTSADSALPTEPATKYDVMYAVFNRLRASGRSG
jgi:membrane-associated phospholipid phosphatase